MLTTPLLVFCASKRQRRLLRGSGISLSHLQSLFDASERDRHKADKFWSELHKSLESMFCNAPFRILLPDLPQKEGSSKTYKKQVEQQLRQFQEDFAWIMKPLSIPLALEVIVKPPLPSKRPGTHDVDNILRNYIIPKVVDVLQPQTDLAWIMDANTFKSGDLKLNQFWQERLATLPRSTRIGITRYEVWRVPRAKKDKSPGYVSVALADETFGHHDIFDRIDRTIRNWEEHLH